MRTPMNAVINYAKFGMEESTNSKDSKYFKQIYTSGNYLLELLNEILDIEENNNPNDLKKELVSLDKIILDILIIITPKVKSKNIKFAVNLEKLSNKKQYIFCNNTRIIQMITNSLNNAIKYIEINQSLTFGVNLMELENDSQFLEYTITCSDNYGEKTTSTSKIPIKLMEKNKTIKTKENIENKNIENYNNQLKILVCEDNEINFKILEKLLKSKNYNVDSAENGLIGLNKTKENIYDLIIMDIKMPIMDGLEATKEIRKFNKYIPIIAVSANTSKQDIAKSLTIGINKYLSKPIDPTKLFQTLEYLLKKTDNSI